jgi:tetratricopeptide (TPR) repeat protein
MSLFIIAAIAVLAGCNQKPAAERAKQSLERSSSLFQTGQYDLALREVQEGLGIIQENPQDRLYDSTLLSNALWLMGACYMGIQQWDSACYSFNASLAADVSISQRAPVIAQMKAICCDPARGKLSDYQYDAITHAFNNASYEFQFLVGQRMMPYGDFLNLPLDEKIKICNRLGQRMNMQEYVWVMALQEWLPVDASVAATIAAY